MTHAMQLAQAQLKGDKKKLPRFIDPALDPSLLGLLTELQRAFDWWNARYWDGDLPPVVFVISKQPSNGHKLGTYQAQSWDTRTVNDSGRPILADEIAIYGDVCLSAGPVEVFETLVHEMAHHAQQYLGKPGKGAYHGAGFHKMAAKMGLITYGPKGMTKEKKVFLADLKLFAPRVDLIPFYRQSSNKKKGKMIKYLCSCKPAYSVYAGKASISIHCNDCDEDFEAQS